MTDQHQTLSAIAAVSTPPGKGGVAVIRVSGADALTACDQIFFPRSGKRLSECKPRMQVWGDVRNCDGRIDDGMATYFAAPHSYTGEDTVEISCHGGMLVTSAVLEAILATGVRMAGPGEFTRRAFLSGKISLTEAEAVGDLLDAGSMAQVRLAAGEGKTKLSEQIDAIHQKLVALLASLFARIDYPDEDLGDFTPEQTLAELKETRRLVKSLLSTYRTGKAIRQGIRTVICGKPNVGKSTLYNLLLGQDAAIVTDVPGTTRDVLTASLPLGSVLLHLQDTAGIRENTDDPIEKIGVERSRKSLQEAELILALFDTSRPADDEDRELLRCLSDCRGVKIAVLTKDDAAAPGGFDRASIEGAFERILHVSAKDRPDEAREELTKEVTSLFTDEKIAIGEDAILSSARQNAALLRALEYLDAAIEAFSSGAFEDAAASEVELALSAVSEINGKTVSEEVVNNIFSRFCVGK